MLEQEQLSGLLYLKLPATQSVYVNAVCNVYQGYLNPGFLLPHPFEFQTFSGEQ